MKFRCDYDKMQLQRCSLNQFGKFWNSEQGKRGQMIETNLAQAVDATNDAGFSNLGRVKGTMTEDNVSGEGIIIMISVYQHIIRKVK